jgi:hypothetical protein
MNSSLHGTLVVSLACSKISELRKKQYQEPVVEMDTIKFLHSQGYSKFHSELVYFYCKDLV